MTELIHELLLHVVVVLVAGVMFRMLVVVHVGLPMMSGFHFFLRLWFRRLRGPKGSDPDTGQPHVGCQNVEIGAFMYFIMLC